MPVGQPNRPNGDMVDCARITRLNVAMVPCLVMDYSKIGQHVMHVFGARHLRILVWDRAELVMTWEFVHLRRSICKTCLYSRSNLSVNLLLFVVYPTTTRKKPFCLMRLALVPRPHLQPFPPTAQLVYDLLCFLPPLLLNSHEVQLKRPRNLQ